MSRFVGRSGEKRFSALCSDTGITCNPAIEDDHGWDHVVEFPYVPSPGIPADMQLHLPAIFVQTKSHEADGLRVTMKLSNAVGLAKSPNPCFVVLATIPPSGAGVTWHSVHVWGGLLERILKRARKESIDGTPEEEFNGKSFTFTMSEADLRDERDLLPWMAKIVHGIGSDYAAAKVALVPPPTIVGNITIGPLTSIDDLIDHTIGLTDNIPLHSFDVGERRLGLDMPFPLPIIDGAFILATLHSHPAAKADVRMRGPDGTVIEVEADLIMPPDIGLPQDRIKHRFRGRFVDIVSSASGAATIKGNFDFDECLSPADLERMLRFASWGGQGEIDVRVSIEDRPVLGAMATIDSLPDQQGLTYLVELAKTLALVAAHLRNRFPDISVADLAQAAEGGAFLSFITATGMNANFVLQPGATIPELNAGIGFGIIHVGNWVFAAIQRFPVEAFSHDSNTGSASFGKPILLQPYAFHGNDRDALEAFKADYLRFVSAKGVMQLNNVLVALNGNGAGEGGKRS